MQLHTIGVGFSHGGNWLAFFHRLALLDQQLAVVRIHRQQGVVVFDQHQVAIAAQAGTRIHDLAIGAGVHRVALLAGNADALVSDIIKRRNHNGVFCWPGQIHTNIRRACRCGRWCSRRSSRGCGGPDRGHGGSRRAGRGHTRQRHHAQHLANLDRVGVGDPGAVPLRQVAPVDVERARNAADGVTRLHGVVAGFARKFGAGQGGRIHQPHRCSPARQAVFHGGVASGQSACGQRTGDRGRQQRARGTRPEK